MFFKNFGKQFYNKSGQFFNKQGSVLTINTLKNSQFYKNKNFQTISTLSALGFTFSATYFLLNKNENIQLDGFYEITIQNDFKEGETRSVQVGPQKDDKVLVSLRDGEFYCVSNSCAHFGFGLDNGVLFNDKVTCPLHMAQFSVKTGEQEYGPVFKGLETFEIKKDGDKLHIKVAKDKLNKGRTLPMSKKGNDSRRFVIIGGGPAGLSAAETLRQSGFEGEITIVTNEDTAPYDRTMLTKNFAAQKQGITIRSEEFLKQYDINLVKGTNVSQIDTHNNQITTSTGNTIQYERLLIASGATPIIPPIPNITSKGVYSIRTYNDLDTIRQHSKNAKNVVVIGAGFIGLESASAIKAYYKDQPINITVVDVSDVPLSRVLGKEIGKGIQQLHQDNGIKFELSQQVKNINANKDGQVTSVQLSSGKTLDADLVIVGTGVSPNSKFIPKNINLAKDGGIITDIFQKVNSQPNIYAAGDVASYPWWYTGQNVRIEHYNEAIHQGYIAALNMLGKTVPNSNVPFFWTRFHNKSIAYTGHAQQFDDIHIEGDIAQQKFLAYYFWNNQIVAAASMGMMGPTMIINEAMKQNVLPKAEDIKSGRINLNDIKEKVQAKGHNCRCKRGEQCGSKK